MILVALALLTFNLRGAGTPLKVGSFGMPTCRTLLGDYNRRFVEAESPSKFPLGGECRYWSFGWPCTFALQPRYAWDLEYREHEESIFT